MEQYIIGVDIGTGSTKAVAVNVDGKCIADAQYYYKTDIPQPGYSEQDPEIIWQAFVKSINEISEKITQAPLAVSFSSCMHSLLVIDKQNKPLTPLITWADGRSEKIAESIRKSEEGKNIYKSTGAPIHAMLPLCKIKWFKENEKEIFSNAVKFISIKEFIWFRLFNRYEIDHSIASATGLFNIENFNWNRSSLELCGISADQLSEIVATDFTRKDIIPSVATFLRIPVETKFCIGASDGCLANLGSGAIHPGIAAITIGTSGALRIASQTPIVNYESMIFNYVLDRPTFISGGPVNNGGNVLKWAFKSLLNNENPSPEDYKKYFRSVDKISAGSRGLLFLPYLFGERAPIWDETASGIFFGIRYFHTNDHFLRSVLEGICFTLKNILEIIESAAVPVNQINVSGGFVHSQTWMQLLADITGKELYIVQTEDASSIGAAMMGLKALKIINDYVVLNSDAAISINPNLELYNDYKKYYEIFKTLYNPLKESMHQLQKIETQ